MVTGGTEVVVGALGAFPADADDGLLPAGVAHGAVVLDTCETKARGLEAAGKESPVSALYGTLQREVRGGRRRSGCLYLR